MKKDKEFGCIEVETGKFREGYINRKGKMAYKSNWFKNLFRSKSEEPREKEFLGTTIVTHTNSLWGYAHEGEMAVYRESNPLTGKIHCMYAQGSGRKIGINVDVYQSTGKLIKK